MSVGAVASFVNRYFTGAGAGLAGLVLDQQSAAQLALETETVKSDPLAQRQVHARGNQPLLLFGLLLADDDGVAGYPRRGTDIPGLQFGKRQQQVSLDANSARLHGDFEVG